MYSSRMNPSNRVYDEIGSSSNITNVVSSSSYYYCSRPMATAEGKAAAACKSHSEAEKRRRKRINGHLATLRSLLPNTIKTDKASLLAEVVRRVRELKDSTAKLLAAQDVDSDKYIGGNGLSSILGGEHVMVPSETDELRFSRCEGDHSGTVKVTMSCDDRPDLMAELTRALRAVDRKLVRAEMATVGGRSKSVMWIKVSGREEDEEELRKALKVVIDKTAATAALSPLAAGGCYLGQPLPGNKRSRLSQ